MRSQALEVVATPRPQTGQCTQEQRAPQATMRHHAPQTFTQRLQWLSRVPAPCWGRQPSPMSESILKTTTREFQWRQTNCACAFYCVKGQYIVFQPTTTALFRTCTVFIKKYGSPLVAFTNTKLWHDPPLEILPVAPGHQQPPNIGLLPRDCWWTVATLEAPGILNKLFQH